MGGRVGGWERRGGEGWAGGRKGGVGGREEGSGGWVGGSLASMTLYRLRRGERSGKTPLPGFVLIARASDKINEIHGACPQLPALNSQFSFGLQHQYVFTTGRAADLVGGLAFLQTTEQLVTLQQPDKKFLRILR